MMSADSFAQVRRAKLPALCLLLGLSSGCHGPTEKPPLPPEDARRPTLGEIFLEPPISGYAPAVSSLSPDGEWLVLRWAPDAVESGDAKRRLLRTSDPAASANQGTPFTELFPAPPGASDDDARIRSVVWAPGRALLAVAQGRFVWLYHPESGDRVQLYTPPTPPAPVDKGAEPEVSEEDAEPAPKPLGRIVSLSFSPDGGTLRFSDRQELYSADLPLTGLPTTIPWEEVRHHSAGLTAAALTLQWSKSLAVVFDPELDFTEESEEDAELPDDEGPPRRQLEHRFEGRRVSLAGMDGMEWLENTRISPDGRYVFGREVDRSADPSPNLVPNYLTKHVSTRNTRTRVADDRSAPWQLWMWKSGSGERVAIEPFGPQVEDEAPPASPAPEASEAKEAEDEPTAASDEEPADATEASAKETPRPAPWFRSIGWAPQAEPGAPARFAFEVYSEDMRELSIWVWTEGFAERVWHERDPRWIGGPCRYTIWTEHGERLVLGSESYAHSTTPGRAQLFAITPDTKAVRQLTEVEGEVSSFKRFDDGGLVVCASGSDPATRTLFRLSRAAVLGPANPAIIPEPEVYPGTESGWNKLPFVSSDASRIVFQRETRLQPGELWHADFESAEQLTRTTPAAYRRIDWIEPIPHEVEAPDGALVRAHVYLPRGVTLDDLGSGGPRATIVFIHGAGYLQNVTDSMTRYPLNMMFHSRLADLGYPVIDVDYRGSAGYGQDFRTKLQYHLGGLDLDDIHAVVDDLAERGLVDPERVGCYGGSYGGFLTLMALFTAPERWAAGAALRSVTDWRTYNPGYTQPRLGRPSTHPDAYERSSPIDLVDGLEDPLLLLHGLMDRNVFAQDTIRLMEELIDRGLEFDAMLYPSQGHGFHDGPHWLDEYRRIERFLLEHLGPPQSAP